MALQKAILDHGRDVITNVEAAFPGATPLEVAIGICRATFGNGFYDDKLYINRGPAIDKIFEHLSRTGIYNSESSAVETAYEWSYGIMAIAGLSTRRPYTARLLESSFRLDPGIDGRKIDRIFDGVRSCFWFSIGGELLQSHLRGFARVRELRLATLGLLSAMKLRINGVLKVSELYEITANAYLREPDPDESGLFITSSNLVRPVIGHKLLKRIGSLAPGLISKGIVPIGSRTPSDRSDVILWPRAITSHEEYISISQPTIL